MTQHPELTTLKKYLTNQLNDDERYEFESHYIGCEVCRREAERLINNKHEG